MRKALKIGRLGMKKSDWFWIILGFLLLFAFGVASAIMFATAVSAQEPTETTLVNFAVVDRSGEIVPDAGRMDIWVKDTGEDFQSVPNLGNGGAFTLRQGTEYWAFLGLTPWPEPGFSMFKIVDTTYDGVEATTQEVGPYTSFITIGETGYITYTVAPKHELFLPALMAGPGGEK